MLAMSQLVGAALIFIVCGSIAGCGPKGGTLTEKPTPPTVTYKDGVRYETWTPKPLPESERMHVIIVRPCGPGEVEM